MLYCLPLLTPYLIWRSLLNKYPACIGTNEYLYGYARCALEDAYRLIGLKPKDIILYPDYICEVAVNPCRNIGLKIEYYPVDDTMEPDWDKVEYLLKRGAKAILTVNYFGFPQKMHQWRKITDKFKVWWIEDNAHGYGGKYDGIPLGKWGDVSVSSMRKVLPLLSGALLSINNSRLQCSEFASKLSNGDARKKLHKEECLRVLGYLLRDICIPYNKYRNVPIIAESFSNYESRRPKEIDVLSLHLLPYLLNDIQKLNIARQNIFKAWYTFSEKNNLSPVFRDLPSETSPFVFPCYTNSFESRQKWLRWGRKNGIEVYPWPNLPADVLRNNEVAVRRLKHILCFPIHQDIRAENILELPSLGDNLTILNKIFSKFKVG